MTARSDGLPIVTAACHVPGVSYQPHDPVAAANAIHLLRTTQQHHAQLSAMADQKASILIGATFVVFTIILREGLDQALSPALLVLAVSAFVSASLGVIAILPSIQTRPGQNPNYLFFGAFSHVSEEEFVAILKPKLEDFDELATAMIHDIYQLGLVLQNKKYRYLGYAYRVFFAGLIATFMTFIAEMGLKALS
jgi:hypothetical protein